MSRKTARKSTRPRPSTAGSPDYGLMETCRAGVGAHALRDAGKGSDDDVSDAIAQLERCLMQQPKAARGTSSARAGRDFRRARRADKLEPGESSG